MARTASRADDRARRPRARRLDASPAADLVEDLFARADEILAREEYAGIEDAPSFHTKLAGVTFEGRQERRGRLAPGAPLRLVRQPDNEFDANACALFDPHGAQVGFLNRRLAAVLAPSIDAASSTTSRSPRSPAAASRAMGLNVLVTRRDAMAARGGRRAQRVPRCARSSAALPACRARCGARRPLHRRSGRCTTRKSRRCTRSRTGAARLR